jgi:hypothetical protein
LPTTEARALGLRARIVVITMHRRPTSSAEENSHDHPFLDSPAVRRHAPHRPPGRRRRPRRRARLTLEVLEDRLAPATITLTTNADDPTLTLDSLRAAIASIEHGADQNANIQRTGAYGVNDTILFNLPADQRTITLTSNDSNLAFGPTALVITADMTIDATQDGVTLSGNNARRLFAVGSTATLTLEGLTLTGPPGRAVSGRTKAPRPEEFWKLLLAPAGDTRGHSFASDGRLFVAWVRPGGYATFRGEGES